MQARRQQDSVEHTQPQEAQREDGVRVTVAAPLREARHLTSDVHVNTRFRHAKGDSYTRAELDRMLMRLESCAHAVRREIDAQRGQQRVVFVADDLTRQAYAAS